MPFDGLFHRLAPVTTISTLRLQHFEQTSRARHSAWGPVIDVLDEVLPIGITVVSDPIPRRVRVANEGACRDRVNALGSDAPVSVFVASRSLRDAVPTALGAGALPLGHQQGAFEAKPSTKSLFANTAAQ
jgi:hypothetical protein